MAEDRTFANLEQAAGQNYTLATGKVWPLQEWYDSVRLIPISQMTVGDIAKSCRQEVWLDEVIPVAIERLTENPNAGDLYDGELVVSLKGISITYWQQHSSFADNLRQLIKQHQANFDESVQFEVERLHRRLSNAD